MPPRDSLIRFSLYQWIYWSSVSVNCSRLTKQHPGHQTTSCRHRYEHRIIPPDVFANYREQAKGMWVDGRPKKWYYAIPIILVWALIVFLVVKAILFWLGFRWGLKPSRFSNLTSPWGFIYGPRGFTFGFKGVQNSVRGFTFSALYQ